MSEHKRNTADDDTPNSITADGVRLDAQNIRAKSSSKFLSTMKPLLKACRLKCNKRGHLAKSHCADCDHTETCKLYVRPGDIHLYGDLAILDWRFITVTLSNAATPKSWFDASYAILRDLGGSAWKCRKCIVATSEFGTRKNQGHLHLVAQINQLSHDCDLLSWNVVMVTCTDSVGAGIVHAATHFFSNADSLAPLEFKKGWYRRHDIKDTLREMSENRPPLSCELSYPKGPVAELTACTPFGSSAGLGSSHANKKFGNYANTHVRLGSEASIRSVDDYLANNGCDYFVAVTMVASSTCMAANLADSTQLKYAKIAAHAFLEHIAGVVTESVHKPANDENSSQYNGSDREKKAAHQAIFKGYAINEGSTENNMQALKDMLVGVGAEFQGVYKVA